MTYPFGAAKADLEKAFRLPDAPPLEQPQSQDPPELSESERSTLLLDHSKDNEANQQKANPDDCAEMTNRLPGVVHRLAPPRKA